MVQDNLDGLKSDPKNPFSQHYLHNSVRNLFSDTLQVWEHCITSLNVDEMGGFLFPHEAYFQYTSLFDSWCSLSFLNQGSNLALKYDVPFVEAMWMIELNELLRFRGSMSCFIKCTLQYINKIYLISMEPSRMNSRPWPPAPNQHKESLTH